MLLGLGAALVAALLLGLWVMMPSATEVAAKPAPVASREVVTPAVTGDSTPQPRSAPIPVRPRAPVPTTEAPALPGAPSPGGTNGSGSAKDPAVQRNDDIRRWMNTEIFASEQALNDCLGKDPGKLEGYAAIPFKIVKKAGKVVVDAQPADANTFTDGAMVECMRKVTAAMKFDEMPPGVESVSTYRKIVVKDGQVVENWLGPHETTDKK